MPSLQNILAKLLETKVSKTSRCQEKVVQNFSKMSQLSSNNADRFDAKAPLEEWAQIDMVQLLQIDTIKNLSFRLGYLMSCPSIGPNCFGPVQNVLDIGQKTEFRIKSHFGPVLNQFGADLFKTQINLLVSTQLINC